MSALEEEYRVEDPTQELISFLAQNDARSDMDQWYRAELVLKALAPKLPLATGQGGRARPLSFRSSEAHAAASRLADEIERNGVLWDGRRPAEETLLRTAKVVYIWEPGERVAGATFRAHTELIAPKYDGKRQTVLQRLARRSSIGRVSGDDVRRWRSEQLRQKRAPLTFLELFDRRVVHAIRAQVAPSFSQTTQGDLDEMARILRRRAEQLMSGQEPKENN